MFNVKIKSWLFVIVQGILLILLIFFTNGEGNVSEIVVKIGRFIELLGALILVISFYDLRKSLTALPTPKKNGSLQVHGLYGFVRHPMYVGVIALSLGIAIVGGTVVKFVIVLMLLVLFHFKAKYEEQLLLNKYPDYEEYMKHTPRFLPRMN